ncbi:MAG: SMC-Scp complex subunit ScpB [Wenzhouxiangellaceae bacterium]
MNPEQLKILLEGALLAAGQPLTLAQLNSLFDEDQQPGHGAIREALALLDGELSDRAVELVEVAGGYRLQIRQKLMPTLSRLWAEKPPRYSRALLETLAIIAYRQPITRGEIEQIRGVSLSANILKTLQEREWIKVVGHRDIPGRPELLGTTRAFLDYFGLKGLDDLPTLAEIRDIDNPEPELDFGDLNQTQKQANESAQAQQEEDEPETGDREPERHEQHESEQPGQEQPEPEPSGQENTRQEEPGQPRADEPEQPQAPENESQTG